jgi:crotonobetainyl-CoA:carnitine CoA-transferase CaiB-like acyl-CoA transferase
MAFLVPGRAKVSVPSGPSMSQTTLLEGIVVLDVTQVMAGPYCAMLLADMGARVIKVEPPGGDSTRAMAGGEAGESQAYNAVNRGKLGVVLDLRQPDAREAFRRLAATADILVENSRPGVMARLGLDYATLAADHPRLIYASISGYGQTGPWAERGGFDLVAQGVSGIMSVTGEPGRPPVKAGIPVTDLGAGLFALAGILAALHCRDRTGLGQHVDTSLGDAGLALSVWEATEYFSGRGLPGPLGSAHRMTAPYQAFRCADGFITVGAANQRTFEKLAHTLGHPEWTVDARFVTDTARVAHREALAAAIDAETATASRADWLARLDAAGIPCGPIFDYAEAFAAPQARAREMAIEVDHPVLGRVRSLGTPIKMSATPLDPTRRAPLLGEHTAEVLASVGYQPDDIARLSAAPDLGRLDPGTRRVGGA